MRYFAHFACLVRAGGPAGWNLPSGMVAPTSVSV